MCSCVAAQSEPPNVRNCNFCSKCVANSNYPTTRLFRARRRMTGNDSITEAITEENLLELGKGLPSYLLPTNYFARRADVIAKQNLPNCTVCTGCNTELEFMSAESKFLDRTFTNEKGATSSWLFNARTNKTASGKAVVKVFCVPLPKIPGAQVPYCGLRMVVERVMLLVALQKLSDDCGFEDLVPRLWVDKVDAVVPNVGYHIRWYGIWMEIAEGISLENFLHKGKPARLGKKAVLDIMQNKLNTKQVVLAAIFDLLTSQCDRHAQNVFIDERGNIKLIDNEACLQTTWKNCAFDSIFVPTTQKQEIVRLTNAYVLKKISRDSPDYPKYSADPQLLLDYRCYVEGGELGTNYPPKVKQCLQKISKMTVPEVLEHYKLPQRIAAENLLMRATDMITKGYEWTAKYGRPRNNPAKTYKFQPPCCKLKPDLTFFWCDKPTNWEPSLDLPFGNPINGREWKKPEPDPGTYEGGTVF